MAAPSLLAGLASAALLGRSTLPRGRRVSASALAEDATVGFALAIPVLLLWGLAGLPWTPVTVPAIVVGLSAVLLLVRPRTALSQAPTRGPDRTAAAICAEVLLGVCFLVACWKWIRAPLWSWDHFAIWGVKARRIVQDSTLDLGFLDLRAFDSSNPSYPIGLPLIWRVLSPSDPSASEFRAAHVVFAAGLVAAVREAARRLGASRSFAALAAAALCFSPLFWDTEALGLADLPLACLATVSLLLLLEARADPGFPAWAAGAGFGFLSWIKTEGFFLGALLAAAGFLLIAPSSGGKSRWRRRAVLTAAWLLWALSSLAVRRSLLGTGVGFFDGDWRGRLIARSAHPGPIFSAVLGDLGGRGWLGLWVLFGVAAIVSLLLRRRLPILLSGVVATQLGFYVFVYFATYLDPVKHVESSFHRIAAALAPLAILTVVAGLADAVPARRPSAA